MLFFKLKHVNWHKLKLRNGFSIDRIVIYQINLRHKFACDANPDVVKLGQSRLTVSQSRWLSWKQQQTCCQLSWSDILLFLTFSWWWECSAIFKTASSSIALWTSDLRRIYVPMARFLAKFSFKITPNFYVRLTSRCEIFVGATQFAKLCPLWDESWRPSFGGGV